MSWITTKCAYCHSDNPVKLEFFDLDSVRFKCRYCSKSQTAPLEKPEPVEMPDSKPVEKPKKVKKEKPVLIDELTIIDEDSYTEE